jgi:hypothetical protein
MPLLLTESLDAAGREASHLHIEGCAACGEEWGAMKETWLLLGDVPELEVPAHVKQRFLAGIGMAEAAPAAGATNVVPFMRRPAAKWLAQAAAVVIIAGGSYFAGHRTAPLRLESQPTRIAAIAPAAVQPVYSIAETRVLPAKSVSPNIEGRPNIDNVQFVDADPSDGEIGVAFDITSHVTVTGSPSDKSMVRLLSYMLQSDDKFNPSRSRAIDSVREMYADPKNADPEIAEALGRVLRNDEHEGVRIKAVETLKKLPPAIAAQSTRDVLIEALKNDPNPAVRIKAVEALISIARSGQQLDAEAIDTLRAKAVAQNENMYVRVKAAEALSNIHP